MDGTGLTETNIYLSGAHVTVDSICIPSEKVYILAL